MQRLSNYRRSDGAAILGAIGIAFLAACGGSDRGTADTTAVPAATAATPASAGAHTDSGGMSDANILASEIAGDSAEVTIAKAVQPHLSAGPVRDYATLLITDHGKSLGDVHALASKLGITPQLPAGDTTATETSHLLERFAAMSGRTVDTAFVNHEIEDHQHDIADAHSMSAAARNDQVKALVDNSLPELLKHLDRAQSLAAKQPK